MSTFDDIRKLFQDIVVPDIRAINTRLDALEHKITEGLAQVERTAILRQQQIDKQFEAQEKFAEVRYEHLSQDIRQVVAQMQTNHASILNALQIDRRLERLERNEKVVTSEPAAGGELARSA